MKSQKKNIAECDIKKENPISIVEYDLEKAEWELNKSHIINIDEFNLTTKENLPKKEIMKKSLIFRVEYDLGKAEWESKLLDR